MDATVFNVDAPPPLGSGDIERLASIIRTNCIREGSAVDIRSGRGHPLKWFIDIKSALLDPRFLRGVAAEFLRAYGARDALQIACYDGFGATLLGAILAMSRENQSVCGLVIRREPKPSGLGHLVEGEPGHTPCIIIDDIVNSGESAERIVTLLAEYGTQVEAVFAVLSHANPALQQRTERLNLQIRTLFTAEQFGFQSRQNLPEPRAAAWCTRWSRKTTREITNSGRPARQMRVVDDRLIYARRAGGVYCFSLEDGALIWKQPGYVFEPISAAASPTIVDTTVLVAGAAGETVLLDIRTGDPRWRARFGDYSCSSPMLSGPNRLCTQAFRNLSSDGAHIVQYDLDTGNILNKASVDFVPVSTFQELADGAILVASELGELIKVSIDLRVERRRPMMTAESHELIATGRSDMPLVAISRSGQILCIDPSSLDLRTIGHATGSVTFALLRSSMDLYVASSRNWIYRLTFDPGAAKIKRSTNILLGRVVASVSFADERLFVADTAGWLYELDSELNVIAQKNFGHGIEQLESDGRRVVMLHQNGNINCVTI